MTNDHGYGMACHTSDNNAVYVLTSSRAHDEITDYQDRYGRWPSSRWYNQHFRFERIK